MKSSPHAVTALPSRPSAAQAKYRWTALVYDLLDHYWERRYYRAWRSIILTDVTGNVLELGVGTGRNLEFYSPRARLTAVDTSSYMLARAARRASDALCPVRLLPGDAADLRELPDASFDWVVATFLCCVVPAHLQPRVFAEIERVLRPGARFRLLEIVYSPDPRLRRRQERIAPVVEWIYGARFDRGTLDRLKARPGLRITDVRFLRADTYQFIEGNRVRFPHRLDANDRGTALPAGARHMAGQAWLADCVNDQESGHQ